MGKGVKGSKYGLLQNSFWIQAFSHMHMHACISYASHLNITHLAQETHIHTTAVVLAKLAGLVGHAHAPFAAALAHVHVRLQPLVWLCFTDICVAKISAGWILEPKDVDVRFAAASARAATNCACA
jgi:hypothetical protein